ncbi:cadmium-translocating P-type ATPase [Blastococcus sp. TML/M2B]|uniref:heavy metal translocating P-type ATPase n=1 Tax=unclassified Blastococcus TaxID=2619396 RepID=UPI00190C92FA|nr:MULTISPECIES: heavy metal translocating P-type ATPase [unclassified Blastococcus]MBN1093234.1 cadmium-translocating P-type ATPase [Blastococcus sp. TML/M2B]MBN1096655.1 cadmium-translocating P-type ATPase [Blastococcus sp. TML/C7B]
MDGGRDGDATTLRSGTWPLRTARRWVEPALLVATTGLLAAGGLAWATGAGRWDDVLWAAATLLALVPAVGWVVVALLRGRLGVDLIAVLALVGTLAVGEHLAGALIAVMLATGRALDAAAQRRATRDLRALLERAPRTARRRVGGEVTEVDVGEVAVDDVVVVGPGEVLPVDGEVLAGPAVLDESALSGEAELVERAAGDAARSGTLNAGGAFELRCTAPASRSTYAGIVALVEQAGADTAPVVRLADRFAAWFLPLSLAVAGLAWAGSGSAERAVAVLVVATPCPLLLAAPVAIVSGLSRTSRLGVVVRTGGALENLGHARTMVVDKTGTLTAGRPAVVEVLTSPGGSPEEVLRLAASADQLSPHVLAEAVVAEARVRGLGLSLPTAVEEVPGRGVAATVDGVRIRVGKREEVPGDGWARTAVSRAGLDGCAVVWVEADAAPVGAVLLRDPVRADAGRTLRRLRAAGIERLVMLTGDRPEPAREVGAVLGLDEVRAQQTPQSKVDAVRDEQRRAVTIMVGDGLNDAPALAAATVGIAMGARGATASSEAADVVLTTDRLDRVADAMEIARHARRIAVQSAVAGMGMSLAAMAVAAVGLLPPAFGALLQEAIDVAVIVNALRALRGGEVGGRPVQPGTQALLRRFEAEHDDLRQVLPLVREAADALATGSAPQAVEALHRARAALEDRLVPHEEAEEAELYPALARALGSGEAVAPMSRAHAEIGRLTRRLATHLHALDLGAELDPARRQDLLACLYGLHALLELHYLQEEENYFAMATDRAGESG